MNWESKVEMCQLFNEGEQEKAVNVFLANLDEIDEQAVDMFITGVKLVKEDLLKSKQAHISISKKLADLKVDGVKTAIRLALYDQLIEEIQTDK